MKDGLRSELRLRAGGLWSAGWPKTYRPSDNRAGEESEDIQLALSRPWKMRQWLEGRVGIRQPVREAEVS